MKIDTIGITLACMAVLVVIVLIVSDIKFGAMGW